MSEIVPYRAEHADLPLAIATTLVVQTCASLIAASVPVVAPEIARARAWNVDMIAFYLPIVYLIAFIASLFTPRLLSRLGGMRVALGAAVFCAVGISFLLIPFLPLLVLAPMAIGCATGAMNPASAHILGPRSSPRSASLVMSIKQTGVPLGGALAGAVVPVFVLHAGWQVAILELGIGTSVVAAAMWPTVHRLEDPVGALPRKLRLLDPLWRLLAIKGMLMLMLSGTAFVAIQLCLRSFFTVYLVRDVGLTFAVAGAAFGISQLSGLFGQIGWAALSDRALGPRTTMAIIGLLMTLAAVLTAGLSPAWPVSAVMVVAGLFGFTAAGFVPVILGEIVRRAEPGQAGLLTSGAQMFFIAGFLAGPLGFGSVASMLGYATAYLVLALCAASGAALAWAGRGHDQVSVA